MTCPSPYDPSPAGGTAAAGDRGADDGLVATIAEVQAAEIRGRMPTPSAGRRGRLLVRLRATMADGEVLGSADVALEGRAVVSALIDEPARRLVGQFLGLSSTEAALAGTRRLLAMVDAGGPGTVWPVRAALETAALDLVAAASGRSVSALLGRRRSVLPAVIRSTTLADAGQPAGPGGASPWVRVVVDDGGQATNDRARRLERLAARSGVVLATSPINDDHDLFGRLVSQLAGAGHAASVVIEHGYGELDGADHRCDGPSNAVATVLAGEPTAGIRFLCEVARSAAAQRDQGPRLHGGVMLVAERLGGPLRTLELAERLHRTVPDVPLILAADLGGLGLGAAMNGALATALPRIDALVAASPASGSLEPAAPDAATAAGQEQPGAGSAVGLGVTLDLADLLPDVRAFHTTAPKAPSGLRLPPNRFSLRFTGSIRKWSLDGYLLQRECLVHGLRTEREGNRFLVATEPDSGTALLFRTTTATSSAAVGARLAWRKQLTRSLLHQAGVPVPAGRSFPPEARAEAVAYADALGYPVVVKPAGGSLGDGVTTDIRDEGRLRRALAAVARSRFGRSGVIIERFLPGSDYRFFVADGQVRSVIHRLAGHAVGDGMHTVTELAAAKNHLRRSSNPYLGRRPLTLGPVERDVLAQQGVSPASVPRPGQTIVLAAAANVARGGDSVEVLRETHPDVLALVGRVSDAVPGLTHAGVDVVLEDHRVAPEAQAMGVIELNSNAEFAIHHFPMYGAPTNVARQLLRAEMAKQGLSVPAPRRELTIRMTLRGSVREVGFPRWLSQEAERLRLNGRGSFAHDEDLIEVVLRGTVSSVGAVTTAALWAPRRAEPVLVLTDPVDERVPAGFSFGAGAIER